MPRPILVCAVVIVLALPCRAEQAGSQPETLIRLNVSPAAAPKPALRYRLLPELKEMNPGNPIQDYMKCALDRSDSSSTRRLSSTARSCWPCRSRSCPRRSCRNTAGPRLGQADWAARLDNPDWQILLKLKADGIATLLPDVQQMRRLARALQVRFRAEVGRGRFDDAIRTAKTMFAMSRHLGEHPTFIGDLVGIAIASVAIEPLEEMLEQPGCPNLYWALTTLAQPLGPPGQGHGRRAGDRWRGCSATWTTAPR